MAAEAAPHTPQEPPANVTVDGKTYPSLADGEYDVIVLGTGLKEVLLAGMLAKEQGKRVLVIDRNSYYGGEAASLNLTELYKKFMAKTPEEEPPKAFFDALGENRDYCVDLVPKFVMADGLLVKILLKMNAQDYIDFRLVDGSYVYKKGSDSMFWGKAQLLHKVPATESEALSTGLVSMWGKRGLRNFLVYIKDFDPSNKTSWKSFDPNTQTAAELFAKFSLDDDTVDFVGHAMALQDSDAYLNEPAMKLIDAVKLYATSLAAHSKSPYLYPVYGLSGLPEAFSRVCSVRGGIFMLHHDVDEILFSGGKVAGVRVGEQAATAPVVIADPSYAPKDRVQQSGRIVRTIALLNHPVEQVKALKSAQIIIPQKQIGRAHDVYMTVLSDQHNVVAKNKFVAICSTVAEGTAPKEEVAAGVALLGDMVCRFDNVSDTFAPKDDGSADNLFVTSSLDATSHFESVAKEVLSVWKRITGSDFNLAPAPVADGAAAAGGQ